MKRFFYIFLLLSMLAILAACQAEPQAPAPQEARTITLWSTEELPERAAKTQEILMRFKQETGITVELVVVNQDQLPNLIAAGVAGGTLPDVIFFPVDFAIGWARQGVLNTEAASEVIASLGSATFAQGALDMVRYEGGYAAVPTDGWGQILVYRKDLFDAAGLERPDTYERIQRAAEALHDPEAGFYGITASTDASAVFTQQTFEQIALANNCQLVDASGRVAVDSQECIEAIAFYTSLLQNNAPPGVQDVNSTRATYLSGHAAMVIWSPFILDEMAGLRDNVLPDCAECADDRAYLASVSGIVPALLGPRGLVPAQYGQFSLMGITTTADAESSSRLLEFWLNDAYLDWLSVSVEGKFPMRQGTPEQPNLFVEGWKQLETGVDRRANLGAFYDDATIQTIIDGAGSFQRWGFTEGQGALVAAVYESLVVPEALRAVIDGELSLQEAANLLRTQIDEFRLDH